MKTQVLVLGSFVVDITWTAPRLPVWGETLLASDLRLGPGGKGSNQAVAAARAGAAVSFITKIGQDAFGDIGQELWAAENIDAAMVLRSKEVATGAAAILLEASSGQNAILIAPGACGTLNEDDLERASPLLSDAKVLLTQLEVPLPAVLRGLQLARAAGVTTVLNPAPSQSLSPDLLRLVDFLIPNEAEAAHLTGLPVHSFEEAATVGRALQHQGARNVLVTMGAKGACFCPETGSVTHVPACHCGAVVDTAGAGDVFCGYFAAAISEGREALDAARFASAAAGLSVTRPGTALSSPRREEVDSLLR